MIFRARNLRLTDRGQVIGHKDYDGSETQNHPYDEEPGPEILIHIGDSLYYEKCQSEYHQDMDTKGKIGKRNHTRLDAATSELFLWDLRIDTIWTFL